MSNDAYDKAMRAGNLPGAIGALLAEAGVNQKPAAVAAPSVDERAAKREGRLELFRHLSDVQRDALRGEIDAASPATVVPADELDLAWYYDPSDGADDEPEGELRRDPETGDVYFGDEEV